MDFADWPLSDKEKVLRYLQDSGYRSERYRVFYISTPKVACTTLKWWFAALEGKVQDLRAVTDSAESDPDLIIHGHNFQRLAPSVTGLSTEVLEDVLTSDSYFRFAVVRNPFKRVFSAWQSKLLLQESLQIGPYRESAFLHYPINDERDIASAFESFLEHLVCNESPTFWDLHWSPQVDLLRPDLIDYSGVFKIEAANELGEALADWTEGAITSPFAGRRRNESLIPYLPRFITARSAELIAHLYAKDFEAFGYDKTPPESKETFSAEELAVALNAIKFVRARHHRLGERNERINQLNQALGERDSLLSDLKQKVAEHQSLVQDLNQAVADRDSQLHQLTQLVNERDGLIVNLVSAADERDGQINRLSNEATQADQRIASLDQALAERDHQVSSLSQSISDLHGQIASLGDALAERELQVAALDQSMSDQSALLADQKKQLADQRRQLAEQHQKLADQHQQITMLDSSVAERNVQLAENGLTFEERGGHIDYLHQRIHELNEHIEHLNHVLVVDYRTGMERAELELSQVRASRSWRITAPLRRLGTPFRTRAQSFPYSWILRIANTLRVGRKRELRKDIQLLEQSPLFDVPYYLATYPDVQMSGMSPIMHYLMFGALERRNPSAEFNVEYYLAQNPDVLHTGMNPLVHYLKCGMQEGRLLQPPVEWLDEVHAPEQASEEQELSQTTAAEEEQARELARRIAFEEEVNAIEQSGLFDKSYYLSRYPDMTASFDLVRHYCEHGWREGRDPSDDFSTAFYLNTYEDIKAAGLNPLWHYVIAGANESRQAIAPVATQYEDDIWFGRIRTDIQMLAFYRTPDWSSLRGRQPAFSGHAQPVSPDKSTGFYDSIDPQIIRQHAVIAMAHGIRGFCFEVQLPMVAASIIQPVDVVMDHADIQIPFCVQISIADVEQIEELAAAVAKLFVDQRYIRVESRPLLLVDCTKCVQDPSVAVGMLRSHLAGLDVDSLFVIGLCEDGVETDVDAASVPHFDAVMDHPYKAIESETASFSPIRKNGINVVPYNVVALQGVAKAYQVQSSTTCPVYQTVTLARDTTTQGSESPLVYSRFDLKYFRYWLDAAISGSRTHHGEDRRFVFVNAWNDWNSSLFVEPDKLTGYSRVNEVSRSLLNQKSGIATPKVSVIVANYNHGAYLERRLESIYRQSYTNLEVILLDDCSSDNSREVLDRYAAAYPEVTRKLYNVQNSGGTFRQWAKGVRAATGDLVWIAESDDYCDDKFVEKLVRCFDDEAVQLAYAKSAFVDKYEVPMNYEFSTYMSDLTCADKWSGNYVDTAHNEVNDALGIKNTIPNASSVLFRRPVDMPLLDDETWLSMRVAGDWVFYLHVLRGGKIAFRVDTTNYFRRYQGSTAEVTYKREIFYREVGLASRTVAALYDVPLDVLERCRKGYQDFYWKMVGTSQFEFDQWYDYDGILAARENRKPTIMVSTMGFSPGGAEILPIRLANEFKRQGHSVLLLSANMNPREEGVRRMLRNDVPLVETSRVDEVQSIIQEFGVEALNSHQWHIQKYPVSVPTVFSKLGAHVASLHGMIEHGDAFQTTEEQLRAADGSVTTWVYTADKNLVPFSNFGLNPQSEKFIKIPNGLQPPLVSPVSRAQMGIAEDAFVLCCVSRAIPDKGWAEAIEAVGRARELSGIDIQLILVGNGPVHDEYCRIGVPDFVYLAGFSENAVGYYAAADMGIMLTKFKSESFPLTIVDCLFAGKPYIASDVGDIANMLASADGMAGEVIPLEDWEVPIEQAAASIAAFASDQNKYAQTLALVAPVASRYQIDVVAKQYIELFERDVKQSLTLESIQ